MADFWTAQEASPPSIGYGWRLLLLFSLWVLALLTKSFRKQPLYKGFFFSLQVLQIVALYSWYLAYRFPLSISLPLYHCRLSMFGVLLLPDRSPLKQYFATMGIVGTILAFVYPILDNYAFPHLTFFTFFLGHLALYVNSLLHLSKTEDGKAGLSVGKIVGYTLLINIVLVAVNQLTGGDYGFLRHPPVIGGHSIISNYIVVSMGLSALLVFTHQLLQVKPSLKMKVLSKYG